VSKEFESETKHVDDVTFHGLSVGFDCLLKNSNDSIETEHDIKISTGMSKKLNRNDEFTQPNFTKCNIPFC